MGTSAAPAWWATTIVSEAAASSATAPPSEEAPNGEAVDFDPEPEPPEDDAESEISSISGSDASAEGKDVLGILADDTAAKELLWFKQGAKTHVARELTDDNFMVPYCRDSPFAQDPARRGEGFVEGGVESVCNRCLARMPRGLYLAIAEYNGWSHWGAPRVKSCNT